MSITTARLLKIIPCQCHLGEGVLWHDGQQAIYWLDIEACDLYRYYVSSEVLEKFTLLMRILAIEKVEARLIPELYCYIAFFLAVFPVFALYYTSI